MAPVRYSAVSVVFTHESSLRHDTGAHPEQPARISAITRALDDRGWLGWERRDSPAASQELLTAIHPREHVEAIEHFCAAGGGMIDMDTVASPGSFEAACHAAGGAAALVDALLGGEARAGASLHRPPGHHAEKHRAMGFCLFNNVAVAARRARDEHGTERVLVLDWDVHHGNGTNDIFHGDRDVLFVSIHQSPLYPGSGAASDVGRGEGEGFTVNLPVPGGSGDEEFCSLVEHVVAPLARAYEPGLLLVSAGFDAHAEDPLAGCSVTDAGYGGMAASMRALAGALDVPLGIVLEGGYALGALSRSVVATLEAVGDGGAGAPDVPLHPLSEAALGRLAPYWPALG
jgi:acetoin utilization deacetylase AcuC-like enzyme